jgi:hypothetical protein
MATESSAQAAASCEGSAMKLAGVAGLAGAALGIAGGIAVDILEAPGTTSTAAEIAAFVHGRATL